MPDVHLETAYFSGRVQGVGFRYAALQVAREFEVSGFVANLDDGRVLIEVEGSPGEAEAFIAAVRERMHGHILAVERSSRVRAGQYSGFSIR